MIDIDTLDVAHRLDGWQKRFVYLVDEELAKPFDWSYAHCADLMACSILACYGTDHPLLELLPNDVGGEAAALNYLQSLGGFETILSEWLVEVPASHAFNADIALFKHGDGILAGAVVCDGQLVGRVASRMSRRTAVRFPLTQAYKIYRV